MLYRACFPYFKRLRNFFSDEQVLNAFEKPPIVQRNLINEHNLRDKLHIKAGLAEQVIQSLTAKLIGNTAEKIMRLLKTDLLILPPHSN